jgi:hypothetical protein
MANMGTKKAANGTILGTYRVCGRCKGTGWWSGQVLRGCFACGGQTMRIGSGRVFVESAAGKIARMESHAAQVRADIAEHMARLEKLGPNAPRWKRMSPEAWLARDRDNLARIEGEIASTRKEAGL